MTTLPDRIVEDDGRREKSIHEELAEALAACAAKDEALKDLLDDFRRTVEWACLPMSVLRATVARKTQPSPAALNEYVAKALEDIASHVGAGMYCQELVEYAEQLRKGE